MNRDFWNKLLLSYGFSALIIFVGTYIGEKTSPYNLKNRFQKEPEYTIEYYVDKYNANTYIDELETNEKTRSVIGEMYKLDECICIVDLLTNLKLKEYSQYIPLTEEEKNKLNQLSYDEILILKEAFLNQESKTYEGETKKELLERSLSYLLLQNETFVREEGQRIALDFGKILLQSSVAQSLKKDPTTYEEFVLSFDENLVEYQDEVLENMAIALKKRSTYARLREMLNLLDEKTVDYETLKEILVYYKYAVISTPVYENGTVKDGESWWTLHKEINE